MDSFKPSRDFVARTMENVRSYDRAMVGEKEQANALLLSEPALFALTAGGLLLGMLNLVRMVWTLISPAACL
jgi:hypothetical protein